MPVSRGQSASPRKNPGTTVPDVASSRVPIRFLVFFLVLCIHPPLSFAVSGDDVPARLIPGHTFPVVAGAQDVVRNVHAGFGRESIEYTLIHPHPAQDIIAFYHQRFGRRGLTPDPEQGYPMRRWEAFDQGGRTWTVTASLPARYVASWVNRGRTVRTLLVLRYEQETGDKRWRERLHVHVSHQQLFRFRDLLPWR